MDIKLDFVPPSLINFVSRQLVGAGFKLYKKEVTSVTKGDEDFRDALKDAIYARIRKALYLDNIPNGNVALEQKKDVCQDDGERRNGDGALELQEFKEEACVSLDEGAKDVIGASGLQEDFKKDASLRFDEQLRDDDVALERQDMIKDPLVQPDQLTRTNIQDKSPEQEHADNGLISSSQQYDTVAKDNKVHSEIEEINEKTSEAIESLDENDKKVSDSPANQLVNVSANKEKVVISSEVRQALGTLEKAISIIRNFGYNWETRSVSGNATVKSLGAEEDEQKDSKLSEKDRIHGNGIARAESPEQRNSSASHGSRRTSSSLCTREANHIKKIAPASPDDYVGTLGDAQHAAARTSAERSKEDISMSIRANTVPGKKNGKRKKKLPFYCCLYIQPGQVRS